MGLTKTQEKRRRWNAAHPEQRKAAGKKERDSLRLQVLVAYGGRCACCGESRAALLAIDHVGGLPPEGRSHAGPYLFYRWLRRNGFPPGFQVLCFNCNHAKGPGPGECLCRSLPTVQELSDAANQ
jgi:hypothetical protein